MNTHIDLNDFSAVFKQYRALVYLKLHQFAIVNKPYVHRLGEQDLLQEALIALWKASKTYDGRLPFHAYAAVLIQRELRRYIRFRYYLQHEITIPDYPNDAIICDDDPAYSITISDLAEHVLKVAKRILTKRQYQYLEYRYFSKPNELASFAEVANRLRCPKGAAKSLHNEALFKLKVAFDVTTKRKTTYTTLKKTQLSKSSTC